MSGWLLDTTVIAALINPKGAPSVKHWAAAQDEALFHVSVLTIGEYEKGIAALPPDDPRRLAYAGLRDELLDRFAGRILSVTDAVVRRWGVIMGTTRRLKGHPPPVIDTMLAATALEAGLCLVTRNIRDVADSGATLFNPWDGR
ncbi:VapC toxin family PIN domain ribonuclease [Niveispirillum lacus]|uniref:Ribonuclease VapC n=1 Tax=Niveispirillum lacus TaxID=1981099 RepID=A0A255YRC0_9PROT|nr:type II toxin-antitoxin system VapC family toxin [Niveispirillum lacus]OYQ31731.1 VapC toxin family PIN domain ribonuclease [Niveispirillum lacus]